MSSGGTSQRLLIGIGGVVGVVALVLGTLAWSIAGASASAHAAVPAPVTVAAEPAPSTTTSSTTSSTTSTTVRPTTTTTPTTVKPRPVVTTTPTTRPPATTTPPTAPRVTSPPPVLLTAATPDERCASARQWVAERGLTLPAGWGFRCPGSAIVAGEAKWGVACWNCAGDGASWIAVDIGRIGSSTAALRYVIAHETCHANDYAALGITTEIGADLCAGLHGAPRP